MFREFGLFLQSNFTTTNQFIKIIRNEKSILNFDGCHRIEFCS